MIHAFKYFTNFGNRSGEKSKLTQPISSLRVQKEGGVQRRIQGFLERKVWCPGLTPRILLVAPCGALCANDLRTLLDAAN